MFFSAKSALLRNILSNSQLLGIFQHSYFSFMFFSRRWRPKYKLHVFLSSSSNYLNIGIVFNFTSSLFTAFNPFKLPQRHEADQQLTVTVLEDHADFLPDCILVVEDEPERAHLAVHHFDLFDPASSQRVIWRNKVSGKAHEMLNHKKLNTERFGVTWSDKMK